MRVSTRYSHSQRPTQSDKTDPAVPCTSDSCLFITILFLSDLSLVHQFPPEKSIVKLFQHVIICRILQINIIVIGLHRKNVQKIVMPEQVRHDSCRKWLAMARQGLDRRNCGWVLSSRVYPGINDSRCELKKW